MTESMDDTVLQRLAHLERARRWWQLTGGMMLALVGALGLIGATGGQDREGTAEVRARAFVLVDYEGRPRMDLRVAQNDNTHLVLMDREGLPRMSLNILAQGGVDVVLRDQLGLPRAALSVVPDGRPGLSLYDAAGTTRVSVGLSPDDKARLILYDQGGQLRWFTP